MPLKDILKKKNKIKAEQTDHDDLSPSQVPEASQFTFMRTDTNTQEIIQPPSCDGDKDPANPPPSKRHSRFRKVSNASSTGSRSATSHERGEKGLSQRLHLASKSRTSSASSVNLPTDLPNISDETGDAQEKEAKWEERATMLARANPSSRPSSPPTGAMAGMGLGRAPLERSASTGRVSDAEGDVW